jgi:hypothetical protein
MSLTFVGWASIYPSKTPCHPEGAFFAPEEPVLRSAEGTPKMRKYFTSDQEATRQRSIFQPQTRN